MFFVVCVLFASWFTVFCVCAMVSVAGCCVVVLFGVSMVVCLGCL